ncbi:hypothetical protein HHK36_021341 [Tetracentron sinense]|uniref:Ubiquitin-like domain-containing protein n=1 Tax=Tetracentron sinense TaxID=13715 RepID=A0A834YSX8_TETSI|nr:hypothetical protein HHK36_021341 [Tetracentron sinense]
MLKFFQVLSGILRRMGSNGADEVVISGGDEAECSETTVEIKIKTLDSQTYTLRVNKYMPVPVLKEQIATVTGVLSEQQRLICRGKVLKDDQLLSAYHVEDGHTLHLVVRQPVPPSSESLPDHPATDPASSTGRRVVVGTFNIADQGDGALPDFNRIVSAVLSSFGVPNVEDGIEGVDIGEPGQERFERTSGASSMTDSIRLQPDRATTRGQSDPLHSAFRLPTTVPLGSLQPPVIPDSLTTLSQYLSHMRHEFGAGGRNQSNNTRAAGTHGSEGQEPDAATRSVAGPGGLPTPASLAEVMLSTRQMLNEQAGECLSQLSRQLEDQVNVTDPLVRMSIQSSAMRSGVLLQNLGTLLLELGRTTMTLRMGQTPSEAIVNAGPAVFISTSGPNPIMVQPLPFQPGTSFGAIPMGTVHAGPGLVGGTLGSGFLPRSIDIRIRTGSSVPISNVNQGEQAGAQQTQGQIDSASSGEASAGTPQSQAYTGESGVRVVPVRTVVAALPASVNRMPTDSSGSPVGLFYPVLARVQHAASGYLNNPRGSQASGERHPTGLETERQLVAESTVQQPNIGDPVRDGLLPTSNSRRQEPFDSNNNNNTPSDGGSQNGQEYAAQIPSSFDQLLRTMFPGEQIRVNFQGVTTDSSTEHAGTTRGATDAQEEAPRVSDEGTFLSSLLRQIMPFISQNAVTEPNVASPERADASELRTARDSSTQTKENPDVGTSRRQCDPPPTPPHSKRQKCSKIGHDTKYCEDSATDRSTSNQRHRPKQFGSWLRAELFDYDTWFDGVEVEKIIQ